MIYFLCAPISSSSGGRKHSRICQESDKVLRSWLLRSLLCEFERPWELGTNKALGTSFVAKLVSVGMALNTRVSVAIVDNTLCKTGAGSGLVYTAPLHHVRVGPGLS